MTQSRFKATMHFNVRPPKRGKEGIIYAVIRVNGKQVRVPTEQHVNVRQWDKKSETCRTTATATLLDEHNNASANEVLTKLRTTFLAARTQCQNDERCWTDTPYAVDLIRKRLTDTLADNGIIVRAKTTTTANKDVVEWLINRIDSNPELKDGTKRMYISKLSVLKRYARKPITTFAALANSDYLQTFYDYLLTNYTENGKAVQTSTANDIIDVVIRAVRKYCLPEKVLTKMQVENIYVQRRKAETTRDEVALLDNEVLAVYNVKTTTPLERTVKDLFVLNCLVGQRFGDLKQLIDSYEKDGNGKGSYHLVQHKTAATVECPVVYKLADTIFQRYHGTAFYFPTNTEFNKTLKDIAKRAGLTEKVPQIKQYGNQPKKTTAVSKYTVMTSHTARRTFATLASLKGWDDRKIKEYTGHHDFSMVDLYTKTTPLQRKLYEQLPDSDRLQMY